MKLITTTIDDPIRPRKNITSSTRIAKIAKIIETIVARILFQETGFFYEADFLKGTGFTGYGKTQPKVLCNKGTALAGPMRSAE